MRCIDMPENSKSGCEDRDREINQQQNMPVDNDNSTRKENIWVGSENWRETKMVEANTKVTNEGYAKTDVEEVDNGLQKTQLRPKPRK